MKKNKVKIGNIEPENPFFLAPLAGVTDSPFRRICKEQGAAIVYTEMVSGKGLYYSDKNTDRLLTIYDEEQPVGFQLFGAMPSIMGYAAKFLADRKNCLLDINMGCPVPKIVKNGEGSAILKDPILAYEIVKAVVDNSKKPVTAKIRIGWDINSVNGVEIAKAVESAGASAIGVHGRTREQYYSGTADWSMIAEIKKNVNIPVIGNGDVFTGQDAVKMIDQTGCDFVMIARGAMGNPWIFRDALAVWNGEELPPQVSVKEKMALAMRQFDMVIEEKGEYIAVREMRKHIAWYLKGVRGSAEVKRKINTMENVEEIKKLILSL